MRKHFDWKSFILSVATIGIPVAMQNLLTTTGSMVDTVMISRMGETSVAAVGLAGQFSSLMFSCYWGFVGGGMLFFSQFHGNHDDRGIERSFGIVELCMMTVAVIFAVLALVFPEAVMKLYTDKERIQKIGVEYLSIVGWAFPLQVYAMCLSACLRATERVKIPFFASICSVLTNTALNWVLIFGHLGAPKLGVKGAAIATVVAGGVNVVLLLVFSKAIHFDYIFHFHHHFDWSREFLKLFFKKCFPIICNEVFIGIGLMVINMVLGRQQEEAIAAVAVFRTIEGLVIGFFSGFSNASSVLVGTKIGEGSLDVAYDRAIRIVYLCQGVIASFVLVLFAFHGPLLHAMSLTGESYRIGTGLLLIYGVFGIIRMGNWVQNDTCRSAGDATTGTVLEITFMYLMVLPALLLSGLVFHLPFLLVFACCYIDEPIRYFLMQRHMYSGRWMRPVTPEGREALAHFFEEKAKKK